MSTAKMRFSILVSLWKTLQKLPCQPDQGGMVHSEEQTACRTSTDPAEAGSVRLQRTIAVLLAARADDFELDAAVLGAALARLVVGDGLLLALAFGVDAVRLDALGDEVRLYRLGAAHGELLVVGVAADRVGVADGDHHFEVHASDLRREIVELRLALGLDDRLVEVEEHVGREGDLLGDRFGLGRRRW